MSQNYLEPVDDGLPMRDSKDYAEDKLRIIEAYVHMFIVSMRGKPWSKINYIDLQAGPGKNYFPNSKILLGSPLIAVTANKQFDNYWFVEYGDDEFNALKTRLSKLPNISSIHLKQGNCNLVVDEIVREIEKMDRSAKASNQWQTLNLAFLDPEGLELEWQTVEKLGQISKMDLIINFSTSGIIRNGTKFINSGQTESVDKFFGTQEWQALYLNAKPKGGTHIRRELLDFYKQRLSDLGYQNKEIPSEQAFRNTKNRQVYTLIFASKHPLGEDFWEKAMNQARQPRLF
jgi:three-Cys-motif partner protein